jgi:acyl-CoA synthetase (AMP-forming)/AMP-acid ligase II/acyl carrier protein
MEFHDENAEAFHHPTLVDLLRNRAAHVPQKLAYAFLQDGEADEVRISYGELDRRARAIAAWLQELGAENERALLLYPAGLDFIAAYFGCLYAGVTAVPVYPPRLNRPSPRIQGIVADAQAHFALTTTQILEKLERRFEHMPDLAALRWLNTDAIPDAIERGWCDPGIAPETLAFLQYTSGSTSNPKGVMVSHGNLMHNLEMIRRGFRIDARGSGVFWLPSYHDMGLIGGILEPMYVNGPSVLMDPAAFLQRPVRWLRALSRYKGTISGAPNFAYQMCVDKVTPDQCEELDLSCWEIAFCGAEPVRHETLQAFAERFAPYGFSSNAFYPCYGLAEGTLLAAGGDGTATPVPLAVSASGLQRNRAIPLELQDPDAQVLVSSGHALLEQQVVVVDPDALTRCPDGEVGEIWIAGPSVAQGYWNRPEATGETFEATLAESGEGPFLRTGDLGFLHEGELYITGRLKDLIIIRGRNHYPQDIEQTVGQCHEAFETGMGAAFAVPVDGEEKLVVTYELKRSHRRADAGEVTAAARRAIAAQHGLQAHAILLLKPLSVPRTSSGKIKRHACRQGFLEGTLDVIGEWRAEESERQTADGQPAVGLTAGRERQMVEDAPQPVESGPRSVVRGPDRSAIEEWLVQQIAAQLRLAPGQISLDRPFVDFGLDSVQAVSLTGELETWLDRSLPATLVWDYPNIRALAAHLDQSPTSNPRSPISTLQSQISQAEPTRPQSTIAIVGLSCRFPGAPDPEAFWRLLHEGIDAIGEVPAERWDVEAYFGEDRDGAAAGKMNTRWGGAHGSPAAPVAGGRLGSVGARRSAALATGRQPQRRLCGHQQLRLFAPAIGRPAAHRRLCGDGQRA